MRRWQRGFTLLELLVGVAIMALVVTGATGTIIALLKNQGIAAGQNAVLPQVHNTSYWVSRDVQMASNVTGSGTAGFPLSLSIPTDQYECNCHTIEYCFDGDKLIRRYYDSTPTLISETIIASHIDTDNTFFTTINATLGLYQLAVTACRKGCKVTMTYEISQRLGW